MYEHLATALQLFGGIIDDVGAAGRRGPGGGT
jgi:hypothetical protein